MAILLLVNNHIRTNPYVNEYITTPNFHIQHYEYENIYEPSNKVHMLFRETMFYLIGILISFIMICYFINEIYHIKK